MCQEAQVGTSTRKRTFRFIIDHNHLDVDYARSFGMDILIVYPLPVYTRIETHSY